MSQENLRIQTAVLILATNFLIKIYEIYRILKVSVRPPNYTTEGGEK